MEILEREGVKELQTLFINEPNRKWYTSQCFLCIINFVGRV
jgi:hypothetical protein